MTKRIILSCTLILMGLSLSNAQQTIKISGNVKFTEPDFKVSVFQRSGTDKITLAETVTDENGDYALSLPVETPGVFTVDCGHWQSVNIWGEDEDLSIKFRGIDTAKVKIKNPPFVYIEGGRKNEVMNLINLESYWNYQTMIAIAQTTYRNVATDSIREVLTSDLYSANDNNYYGHIQYIAENYSDVTSSLAAISLLRGKKYAEAKANALSELEKNFPDYKPLKDYIAKEEQDRINRERVEIGAPAPAFEYPDLAGKKKFGPATFKGKILLIDFWASWCGPCRQEIPNLKETYEKYHNQGVEFLSVSIDAKKEEWEKALKSEQMPWHQALATDSGKELMTLYQFSGIPFIILIDADGKIAAKHLRGAHVGEEIQKLIDGNK